MNSHFKNLYASAARTATPTAVTFQPTPLAKGVHIIFDVTSITATPSVTPTIAYFDNIAQKWYTVLTGSAITATGTTFVKIGPDIATVANVALQDYIPELIRLTMTHGDTDSITYSVDVRIFE